MSVDAGERRRVLLVERKPGLARCVKASLRAGGYAVDVVTNPADARCRLENSCYDALLVDTSLAGGTGFSLAANVRRRLSELPIVFLVDERVREGLVYVAEECEDERGIVFDDLPVLPSRLDALLRETPSRPSAVVRFGDLALDRTRHVVTCTGRALSLTPIEYRIMETLLSHAGRPVSGDLIQARVWPAGGACSNTLAVHIRNIRRKLAGVGHEGLVRTVRGSGYELDDASGEGGGDGSQDSFIPSS